jgi:hypothetical protein
MVWVCDKTAAAIPASTDEEGPALRNESLDGIIVFLKSKLGLVRRAPMISIENSGFKGTPIERKLIDVVSSRTLDKCKPPEPGLIYLMPDQTGVAKHYGETQIRERLGLLLDGDASRGGVIIALHDLSEQMTDDTPLALYEICEKLLMYDKILSNVVEGKNFPDKKILKIAIITTYADALKDFQFPFTHRVKDWVIVAMKRVSDEAILSDRDESSFTKKIDELLGVANDRP